MKALVINEPNASKISSCEKIWEVRTWRIKPGDYLVVSAGRAVCVMTVSVRLRVEPNGEIYLEEGEPALVPDDFEEQVWAGDVPLFFHLISNVCPPPESLANVKIRGRQKIFNVTV